MLNRAFFIGIFLIRHFYLLPTWVELAQLPFHHFNKRRLYDISLEDSSLIVLIGIPKRATQPTMDHLGVMETSTESTLNSTIVNIELAGALW